MKDDKLNVKAWFKKAENDLINAENTIKMESPPTDTICFHAQQCAEKYLKGFLTFHETDLGVATLKQPDFQFFVLFRLNPLQYFRNY